MGREGGRDVQLVTRWRVLGGFWSCKAVLEALWGVARLQHDGGVREVWWGLYYD